MGDPAWAHYHQWQAYHQQQQQHHMIDSERRRKEDQERKKKQDQERKKQEEAKRKREEENKKRLEEQQRKKEEENAITRVMPLIQKVRVSTPESFPALKEELEEAVKKEVDKAGNPFARLREEADKGLAQAEKCIEMILARRRLVEEKKAEEARRQKAIDDKVMSLVEEL